MRNDGRIHRGSRSAVKDAGTAAVWLWVAWLSGCLPFIVGMIAVAQAAELTREQQAVVRSIEEKLIAPCCFRGTLAEHRSDASEKLRVEVRQMVGKGAAEEEVVDYFVNKYGQRILAAPRARGFNLLAYLMPLLGLLGGTLLILALFRSAGKRVSTSSASVEPPAPVDESLRARMMQELERFES